MKTEDSKKWNKWGFSAKPGFLKSDKCEVKYAWYDLHI